MFCDGRCKKKNQRCGLLLDVWLEHKITGEKTKDEKCVFHAIWDNQIRAEHQRNGIHAAQNETRNENVKGLERIKDVVGTGLLGMLKTVERKKLDG